MSWEAWLTVSIVLNLVMVGYLIVLLILLRSHLDVLQRIERIWGAWIDTNEPVKPAPQPGTTFVLSDAELAAREKQLMSNSRQRGEAIRNPASWQYEAPSPLSVRRLRTGSVRSGRP